MVEKYYSINDDNTITFNVVRFIKDHRMHVSSLRNMRDELASLDGIKSVETDGVRVQSSGTGDPTAHMVIVRDRLRSKIKEYEAMISIYDRTMNAISDRDRLVLETMYAKDGLYAVEELEDLLHVERATVYNYRKDAVFHFANSVVGILH